MIKIIELEQESNNALLGKYIIHNDGIEKKLLNDGVNFSVKEYSKICLLDLNKTLAKEAVWDWKTGWYDVSKDVYSDELAKKLMSDKCFVIIVTARGFEYKDETMNRIKKELPSLDLKDFVCKSNRFEKIALFKKRFASDIMNAHGIDSDDVIAVESNAETRKEYKSIGVKAMKREDYLNGKF